MTPDFWVAAGTAILAVATIALVIATIALVVQGRKTTYLQARPFLFSRPLELSMISEGDGFMFILDTELTNHGATPATNVWHATELLVPPSAPDAQRVFAARLKSAFESNPKGVGARGAAHQVAAPGVATVQRHQLTYDGKIEGQLAMHIMGCITYRSAINSSSVHQTWYIAEIKALDGAMPTYTTGMTLPIKAEPYFTGSYIN